MRELANGDAALTADAAAPDRQPWLRRPGGGRLKVVLMTNTFSVAGAETQLFHLGNHLLDAGADVRIITLLPPGELALGLFGRGVPVHQLNTRKSMPALAIVDAARCLRRWQPDVVISFLYQANVVARLAGRLARVPVIINSIRNEYFGGRGRDWVLRLTDRLATVTTTNSETAGRGLISRGVVPAHRLLIIRNGLDLAALERRAMGHPQPVTPAVGGFCWLAAARLEAQKDYPTLLQAFALVRHARPEARLSIAGRGPLARELEDEADRLGIADSVAFLGFRDDVLQLMAAADAVVLSSVHEGMPNALMEALALSTPVVATAVGGTPEVVLDGRGGFLVPPADADALAAAMLAMMELPGETRRQMGQFGREHVLSTFGLGDVLDQWTDLVSSLTSHRQKANRRYRRVAVQS